MESGERCERTKHRRDLKHLGAHLGFIILYWRESVVEVEMQRWGNCNFTFWPRWWLWAPWLTILDQLPLYQVIKHSQSRLRRGFWVVKKGMQKFNVQHAEMRLLSYRSVETEISAVRWAMSRERLYFFNWPWEYLPLTPPKFWRPRKLVWPFAPYWLRHYVGYCFGVQPSLKQTSGTQIQLALWSQKPVLR